MSRFTSASVRFVLRMLGAVGFFMARRVAERREVCGIEIMSALTLGEESPHIRAAAEAIELIAEYDRGLLLRIRRYFRLIMVGKIGPVFQPERRLCILHDRHLESLPVERIALQIAHEAAHARFEQSGFPYSPEMRSRIEAKCVRAEVRLARRIPGADSLVDDSLRQLETPWWEARQISERKEMMLKDAGVPKWLRRLGQRYFE